MITVIHKRYGGYAISEPNTRDILSFSDECYVCGINPPNYPVPATRLLPVYEEWKDWCWYAFGYTAEMLDEDMRAAGL